MLKAKAVNFVIRRYYAAFSNFRSEWDLTAIEEQAYQNILAAYERKLDDFFADVSDLFLEQSIRIAHNVMEFGGDVPVFYTDRIIPQSTRCQADEYWVLHQGHMALRTTDRTAVADWIREHGSRNVNVLVPLR
jgi:hypothetical protein